MDYDLFSSPRSIVILAPQMRLIQFLIKDGKGPVENLYMGEAPEPVLLENQVLVKVKAFGLNRMDIAQREGHYPPPPGSSEILGVEFSGIVHAVGTNTSKWKTGDEVFGLAGGGAYAEYIAVAETHLLLKPSHLSFVDAASIPEAFFTAFQAMIIYGEIKPGENALVHAGASGVGIAAIQLARFRGARTVTATASTQCKLDFLLKMPSGATHAVNYKTQDFAQEVKKITEGKGVNAVVDFVGQSHWAKNIDSMALDGRMTILSFLSGSTVESVNLGPILYKRLRIQGSTLRSRSIQYQTELVTRFKEEILPHLSGETGSGTIKTYIHEVYSWHKIQEAHREMAADANSGKIIVEVD
ncbi:hypothetical protein C8J56DRAFT_1010338 [Mycena floridula]|nr:hypothetical protein C8J56DRAFT_1010338 [Mycena floridula]